VSGPVTKTGRALLRERFRIEGLSWPIGDYIRKIEAEAVEPWRAALRDVTDLAIVADDGDPWYAQKAGIDAEAVLARARALLQVEQPKDAA
jgi:hypothetical protein